MRKLDTTKKFDEASLRFIVKQKNKQTVFCLEISFSELLSVPAWFSWNRTIPTFSSFSATYFRPRRTPAIKQFYFKSGMALHQLGAHPVMINIYVEIKDRLRLVTGNQSRWLPMCTFTSNTLYFTRHAVFIFAAVSWNTAVKSAY